MSATWPTSVATDAILYIAVNALQTTLSGTINNSVTTITLASATGFPTAGGVTIDNEVIFYTGISGAQLTGCVRGSDGTTAASHSSGVPVGATVIAAHHNLLKDEIIAIETSLNLTASQAVVTSASGRVTTVAVTPTEVGYLAGVTSSIQTQLNATISNPSSVAITITPTSNQLVLGVTRTITITAPTPATSSRTWTLPDLATSPTFAALEGTQTFTGTKTFNDFRGTFGADIAAGSHKITGLAAATANGDAVRFEQISGLRILQIVSASTSTVANSTSSSYADTNLSASITPASTSSKILVLISQSCEVSGGNNVTACSIQLLRSASIIFGPTLGAYQAAAAANDIFSQSSFFYYDSPATASSVTYKTQFARTAGTGTASVNDIFNGAQSNSYITLIEIG